jgi:hypothetical protein
MGIDGRQTLTIRGPKSDLDELERTGLVFEIKDEYPEWFSSVQETYFGPTNITVNFRSNTILVVRFDFRNESMNTYFEALMNLHPKCWMKNEFATEIGWCGFWIARFVGDQLEVQTHEWNELCWEEMAGCEDFRKDAAIST